MVRLFLFAIAALCALTLQAAQTPLVDHPSPYIAMHAADPVQWRLWDESLLPLAQKQNKLIFISSGYFACHWCHVMQRESFKDTAIAGQLNRDFIPVKIDRELWPELDAYLIEFVEKTRGSAGWPLNVFITPEGHPLVGTTYLPSKEFSLFLQRLQQRWQKEHASLAPLARRAAMQSSDDTGGETTARALQQALLSALMEAWREQADMLSGGFGHEAKFPEVPLLRTLAVVAESEPEVAEFITLTLEQMASEGLRDHLGGGFFRYTVDPSWQEPHFEKMLIDNAQLAQLYIRLGEKWHNRRYREIGLETLDFMLREMRHPEGGFISALSAVDGKGREGGYYLWSKVELDRALGEEGAGSVSRWWRRHSAAEWGGGELLLSRIESSGGDRATGTDERERLRQGLLSERNRRVLPRDEKRLASWNGAALSALSEAADEGARYRAAAREVRNYLFGLWDGSQLWRMRDSEGRRVRRAGLDDYVMVAQGLLQWSEASGDKASRELAAKLLELGWKRFYTGAGWQLAPLLRSRRVIADGVAPSAVSVLVEVNLSLQRQAPLRAEQLNTVLLAAPAELTANPLQYASYLMALQRLNDDGE